jgi:ABC-type taurine transport system ATPase subunit
MPWLNVIDNVASGLKLQEKPRDEPRKLPIAVRRTRSVRVDSNAAATSLGARGESFAWAPALRNAAGSAGR